MKIIEESKVFEGWWIGRKIRCSSCSAVYQLEKTDNPIKEYPVTSDYFAEFRCGCCGGNIIERLLHGYEEQRKLLDLLYPTATNK